MNFKAWTLVFLSTLMLLASLGAKANNSDRAPMMIPDAPPISAKNYVLIDADSSNVIAEKKAHKHVEPASLTKMMTLYLTFDALKSGQIKLDDKVRISKKAWKMGGSKMFIKAGETVTVKQLIKGIIIASGNDASVALAQYVGGTEQTFVQLMNHAAKRLGLKDTHFTDPTGLPHPEHYASAYDMAKIAQAIIVDFPDYYHWFKEKWITHNGIQQSNRNKLLWHDQSVDGLKTGHTSGAGYCLTASAKRHGMRLIAVVMDTPDENARTRATESLLNYGFRFYETHLLYKADQPIHEARLWYGDSKSLDVGITEPLYITLPKGQYKHLDIVADIKEPLEAPIKKGDSVGNLAIKLKEKILAKRPLIALDNHGKGSAWSRMSDYFSMKLHNTFQ